jgi:SAM-dependent methyltransferase
MERSHLTETSASREQDAASEAPMLRIIGVDRSHDTLRRVVSSHAPCRILDVPAGEGVFCAFLKDRGWQVEAADIDPGNFKLRGVPFTQVNLNKALPFEDGVFDAVSCVNGLHRLVFPEVAIREFSRILKPGGRLYINMNNYSSIWKRLRFLIAGSIDQMIESQECIQTIQDPEAHIRLPLMFPRLHAMLTRNSFEVVEIKPSAVTPRDRLLIPLAMLVSGIARLIPSRHRMELRISDGNQWAVLAGGAYTYIQSVKR